VRSLPPSPWDELCRKPYAVVRVAYYCGWLARPGAAELPEAGTRPSGRHPDRPEPTGEAAILSPHGPDAPPDAGGGDPGEDAPKRGIGSSPPQAELLLLNSLPWNDSAQVKFQLSMKFHVLKPKSVRLQEELFPIYFAYTQKSLWNVGLWSMPFEESNYNPELFLNTGQRADLRPALPAQHPVQPAGARVQRPGGEQSRS